MFFNSIRWRLQLWHGLVLLLVLAGFGFTALQLDRLSRFRRIDQDLQQRCSVLMAALQRDGPPMGGRRENADPGAPNSLDPGGPDQHMPPPGIQLPERDRSLFEGAGPNAWYYVLWRRDGMELSRSETAPGEIPTPVRGVPGDSVRLRDNSREMYVFTPPGECILVGHELSGEYAEMRRLALLLLGVGSGVLALGLAGGWWLSTRAIRPIDDISAAAGRIATGDLSQRIDVADTDNELGRLAALLNSTFARLEAAFAQQRQFTSDATHELRTPVSVVLTQTQSALNRERTPAEYRETVEACQRAAQRMRGLIESLLDLARFDAGQETINRLSYDLAETARECAELVRPLADARGIKLLIELVPVTCMGDSARIGQVITNLLTNAVEYNKPGGEIRLTAQSKNGLAIVTVSDTGPGIAAADLPHLFERFYRADKSRKAGHAGLGLAICKAIVEAHGGTIEVFSQQNVGTTFIVRLPRG